MFLFRSKQISKFNRRKYIERCKTNNKMNNLTILFNQKNLPIFYVKKLSDLFFRLKNKSGWGKNSSLIYEWFVPYLRLSKHPNRIGGVMVSMLACDAILHSHDDLLFVNLFCYYALLYLN